MIGFLQFLHKITRVSKNVSKDKTIPDLSFFKTKKRQRIKPTDCFFTTHERTNRPQ